MQLIAPLGVPADQGRGRALLTFGFLILAAYTIGELAARLRTPKIVGYLLAGVLVGPSVFDLVTAGVIRDLAPVSRLAIALIAFLAGAELDWGELRTRGVAILKMMGAELGLSFVGIFVLLYALRGWIPFLNGVPTDEALSFSALFAAVAVIHSPAVTLALLAETGARGPVARTTLSIVLVADVAVVILFSGTLALTRMLAPPSSAVAEMSLALVAWEIGGSVVVGVLLGGLVAVYLRWVRSELLIFAVVVAFFGAEIARLAHVETLLTLLVAGFVTENGLGQKGTELRPAMERAAAPVFVVFFALAGAQIALRELATFWPLVIPIVLVRGLGIWAALSGSVTPLRPTDSALLDAPFAEAREQAVSAWEREFLSAALERHGGNVSQTARVLHLHRQSLQKSCGSWGFHGSRVPVAGPKRLVAPARRIC